MHDDELNEILRVVDEPTQAPSGFKADLLDDLRAALTSPASSDPTASIEPGPTTGPMLDHPDEVPLNHEPQPRGTARWAYTALTAAAAIILVVALVTLRGEDQREHVEVTNQPEPEAIASPENVPQVPPETACADFVLATTPLDEITDLAATDEPGAQAALETWLTELDRLRSRTSESLPPNLGQELTETRIILRQALQLTERALLVDLNQKWRDATSPDGPLSACRE